MPSRPRGGPKRMRLARDAAVGSAGRGERGSRIPPFELPPHENGDAPAAFRNPAFADNKALPIHRWVPWIAGYSASFVDGILSTYMDGRPGLVLDPFCGVGTTLLQAVLRGHDAVGFEINPYAALAARTKLDAPAISLAELDAALATMQAASLDWRTSDPPAGVAPPPLKSRLPFFSPKVERQVLQALAFIQGIRSEPIADLFRVAFGAVMVSVSNYTYEPSLGSRPAAGKPLVEDADVARVLLGKLHHMRADIGWAQAEMAGRPLGRGRVVRADFFEANASMATGSVRLMVTSPPYMNNYHYVRNTRPQLYWLDFVASPDEQRHLETGNFGATWQTVRGAEPIRLTFEHRGLESTLRQLRAVRAEKGAYGGPGWANYVASYFNDGRRFLAALKRVLARRGVGVIVVGNSIIQGLEVPTDAILGEMAATLGLRLEGVFRIRAKRVGASITRSSVRHGERSPATLFESAVIVRKR